MPVQLMKLRGVPEDELADLVTLLDDAEIAHYQTSAGLLGISLPALWLVDETQYTRARQLIDGYQRERYSRARAEYERQRMAGRARGWLDLLRENPVRYVLYTVAVVFLVWVSTVPWFRMGAVSE